MSKLVVVSNTYREAREFAKLNGISPMDIEWARFAEALRGLERNTTEYVYLSEMQSSEYFDVMRMIHGRNFKDVTGDYKTWL